MFICIILPAFLCCVLTLLCTAGARHTDKIPGMLQLLSNSASTQGPWQLPDWRPRSSTLPQLRAAVAQWAVLRVPPVPAQCKRDYSEGSQTLSRCLFSFSAERCQVCSRWLILCRVFPLGRGRSRHLMSPAGEQAPRICINSQEAQRQDSAPRCMGRRELCSDLDALQQAASACPL